MNTAQNLLVETLQEQRPIVLILGQNAWIDCEEDSVLAQALQHLELDNESKRGWLTLLGAESVPPTFYDWLTERFERRVPPNWLAVLSEIPWSAIFTSSLDPTLRALLTKKGREPEVVLTASEMPRAVRSRVRPPLYHLFGHSAISDPRAYPPTNRRELNTRRVGDAVPLIGRVLDTATTLGLVVVDGFVSGRDWLKADDILGVIGKAAPRQVLWFGGKPRLDIDDEINFDAAVDSGQILVSQERLGTVIAELRGTGRLPELASPESEETGTITFNENNCLETTPEQRLRVEAVASIVDDSWTAFLPPLGPDSEYGAFRRFHGDLEGPRFLVEGIRRGFAIERDFEPLLLRRVTAAINDHASLEVPLIVHGQSGTGKTLALARIVARIRKNKVAAVLYTLDRIPQSPEVSEFCEAAENAGAKATLIVCDANRNVDAYRELLMGLRSRGQRVIVLGSTYRFSNDVDHESLTDVEAQAELSENEKTNLSILLQLYLEDPLNPEDELNAHILAFLYRCLPMSRSRISAGLSAEARVSEQEIRQRGHKKKLASPDTQLARQLIEKGFTDGYHPLFTDEQSDLLEAQDAAGRIIDMVMASGSLDCAVPINLLLRAVTEVSSAELSVIFDMFHGLDLFRWKWADAECNELLVCPRLRLEAELICRRRLGSPEKEAHCLIELIKSVRSIGIDRDHERQFLFNLLRQIGPSGPRGNKYHYSYAEIGKVLTELREHFGVMHPSLMLQESVFRRNAVREEVVNDSDHVPLLEEARNAVQSAIDSISHRASYSDKLIKKHLQVERASIYGYLAYDRANKNASNDEIWPSYLAARSAITEAVSTNSSYFPLDIGLWTPVDLLRKALLTDSQRAELAADIHNIMDQVDPESFSPTQRERFDMRRMQVGQTLQENTLTESAYSELEACGSTAGYYLRAREIAPQWTDEIDSFTENDIARAQQATDFLQELYSIIKNDVRCLSLLLECRWIAEMGRRPFRGQRQPLPLANTSRHEILTIVRALNEASGNAARYVTRYLEAVLAWTLHDVHFGTRVFRELARETEHEYHSRVFRRHQITDADQKPCRFRGRVERQRTEGHWIVRVEEINQTIDLLSRDFINEEIAYGRSINDFAIAFNFIGPIADPIR